MNLPPTPYPSLSQDAAVVLALAETAVPHAASAEDEAERWVRIMRLHGEVGCALQSLGVAEAPLETAAYEPERRSWRLKARGEDVVEVVSRRTVGAAIGRGAKVAGTIDVLSAVLQTYDRTFERALYLRGTSSAELLSCLERRAIPQAARRADSPDEDAHPPAQNAGPLVEST
ncbi:MAG TPA: hypothetical protein VGR10_04280 [Thermoleophilaceae bacterium]|nr:hypothetical protein [Thermoleophilaceae bacterium]